MTKAKHVNATRYSYTALQDDEIRLLALRPGSGKEKLTCDVHIVSLGSKPAYHALSYAWGNEEPSKNIFCGEQKLQITPGLARALQHLRSATDERRLWIDQICINQENATEKAVQVKMMGTVYWQAEEVIIWLGVGGRKMHGAMNMIDQVATNIFSILTTAEAAGRSDNGNMSGPDYAAIELTPPESQEWVHFRRFFRLPWFSRVWTFQEISLARKATFVYGKRHISWARFVAVYAMLQERCQKLPSGLSYLSDVPKIIPTMFFSNQVSKHTRTGSGRDQIGRPAQELLNLVRALQRNQASDPRDKVYALLGIADDLNASTPGVNYTRHFRWVYCDYTKWFIQRYQDLAVLSLVNILPEFGSQGKRSCFQLPTWCLDLRDTTPMNNLRVAQGPQVIPHGRERAYNATGGSVATVIPSQDMLLTIHGIHVGKIVECTDPSGNLTGSTAIGPKVLMGGQWSIRVIAHAVNGKYSPTGEEILLAYSRLRIGDYLPLENNAEQRRKRHGSLTLDMLQPGEVTYSNVDGLVHATSMDIGNQIIKHTTRQRMFFTDSGHMGLCHRSCEVGDDVYLLFGSDMPAVLRRLSTGYFQWKGLSYVHGIMDGQFLLQKYCKYEHGITAEEWLQGLGDGNLPFKTDIITLV